MPHMERVMMLQIMMTAGRENRRSTTQGFTLVELLVVLVLISAMMTVAVPYATRSSKALKANEDCLDAAELFRYAIAIATDRKRPSRIVIDRKDNSLRLETCETGKRSWERVHDFAGTVRYFGQGVRIGNMTGFGSEGNRCYVVLDPAKPWPVASLSLSDGETIKTIRIEGRCVRIEDSQTQETLRSAAMRPY